MLRLFRHYVSTLKFTLVSVDFVILALTYLSASYLRHTQEVLEFSMPLNVVNVFVFSLLGAAVHVSLGLYQPEVIREFKQYFYRLLLVLTVTAMAVSALAFLMPLVKIWRSVLVYAVGASLFLLPLGRLVVVKLFSRFSLNRPLLVLGIDHQTDNFLQYAKTSHEAGLFIKSVVSLPGQSVPSDSDMVAYEDIDDLTRYVLKQGIEAIIVMDPTAKNLPSQDLIACKLLGLDIDDYVTVMEKTRGLVDVKSLQNNWIIFADGFRGGRPYEKLLKRSLDILTAATVLVLAAPIMVLTAMSVKLTSRGPVFYRQERVGYAGKPFDLIKFRSMSVDAEAEGGPKWADKNDQRVTAIGKLIRRTRLDELPQVFNILKGEMSFVGPRPERQFFVDQIAEAVPFYKERHYVKPGLTGWAQLKYPYGASLDDARKKLEYDLYYIKNYSIILDLLIILQTVRVILFPSGAR